MYMICDVQVLTPAGPVCLNDFVATEWELFGIGVFEKFAVLGRGFFPRVHKAVGADVLILEKVSSQVFW